MEALEALFAADVVPFRATPPDAPPAATPPPKRATPVAKRKPAPAPTPAVDTAPPTPPSAPERASSEMVVTDLTTDRKRSGSPRAMLFAGLAGLAIVAVIGVALLIARRPAPAAVAPPPAAPALDPAAQAATALAGAWAPPGACDQPITLAADGDTLALTTGGKTVNGAVSASAAAKSVTVSFPDGSRLRTSGKALVMTLAGGGSMSLTRCAA